MSVYLQVVVNGLLLGGLYAAVAVGFSMVWGVMGIINVSHGALMMIGAYVTWVLFHTYHIDPFLTIPVSMAVLFVVGYLLQGTLINRVLSGGVLATLIITFGLDQILTNLALLVFSANERSAMPSYGSTILHYGGLFVPFIRVIIFVLAILLVLAVHLLLTHTKLGRAIRAVALNKQAAEFMGVDLAKTYNLTFAIGAALAGAAGSMVATVFIVTPGMGDHYLLKAFIVTVFGGMGSLAGALFGGLLLGVAETLGAFVFGTGYQEAIGVGLFLVLLSLRPQGLLGKRFYGLD